MFELLHFNRAETKTLGTNLLLLFFSEYCKFWTYKLWEVYTDVKISLEEIVDGLKIKNEISEDDVCNNVNISLAIVTELIFSLDKSHLGIEK